MHVTLVLDIITSASPNLLCKTLYICQKFGFNTICIWYGRISHTQCEIEEVTIHLELISLQISSPSLDVSSDFLHGFTDKSEHIMAFDTYIIKEDGRREF